MGYYHRYDDGMGGSERQWIETADEDYDRAMQQELDEERRTDADTARVEGQE